MKNAIYWIWLQRALGFASSKISKVIELDGAARRVFELEYDGLKNLRIFTARQLENLCSKDLLPVQEILTNCGRLGYDILTPEDEDYPQRLRNISNPPAVLYVKGKLPDPERRLYVGIVGAREPTSRGADVAYTLGLKFAQSGAVIVSGGARGIDSAAHMGALAESGRTVAVLGCGIDYEYNMSKRSMRDMIASKGAIISEYPPTTPPVGRHFPERNRIISGISHAVVVAQAGIKSGSLITAKLAAEQGRVVFAVEDGIGSVESEGTTHLIENGANPLSGPQDVVDAFCGRFSDTLRRPMVERDFIDDLRALPGGGNETDVAHAFAQSASENARMIYALLEREGCMIADEIIAATGIAAGSVFGALTELEMLGIVNVHPGRRYEAK
ncbi:MAG: DNA-processing protein DprA [Clostridia bacterium]|nr:DNA-processing protein DprA [Clostridia bacterium]